MNFFLSFSLFFLSDKMCFSLSHAHAFSFTNTHKHRMLITTTMMMMMIVLLFIHTHTLYSFIHEKKDSISSSQSENNHETTLNLEDSYANLLKDADKLKLMLLAWNYQNSAAIRNNATGPDLTTMTNLWEQYQNALTGMSANKSSDVGPVCGSPVSLL